MISGESSLVHSAQEQLCGNIRCYGGSASGKKKAEDVDRTFLESNHLSRKKKGGLLKIWTWPGLGSMPAENSDMNGTKVFGHFGRSPNQASKPVLGGPFP